MVWCLPCAHLSDGVVVVEEIANQKSRENRMWRLDSVCTADVRDGIELSRTPALCARLLCIRPGFIMVAIAQQMISEVKLVGAAR